MQHFGVGGVDRLTDLEVLHAGLELGVLDLDNFHFSFWRKQGHFMLFQVNVGDLRRDLDLTKRLTARIRVVLVGAGNR